MSETPNKPATWFWIVSIIALIWNLLGAMAYIMQVTMSPEALAALPPEQRELMETTPAWATGAFAIAVWGGTLASVLLLLRKKLATTVFIISFAGVVVQMFHSFFMSKSIEVYGPGGLIMPIMIIIICIYLIWMSRKATAAGWLK